MMRLAGLIAMASLWQLSAMLMATPLLKGPIETGAMSKPTGWRWVRSPPTPTTPISRRNDKMQHGGM